MAENMLFLSRAVYNGGIIVQSFCLVHVSVKSVRGVVKFHTTADLNCFFFVISSDPCQLFSTFLHSLITQ